MLFDGRRGLPIVLMQFVVSGDVSNPYYYSVCM